MMKSQELLEKHSEKRTKCMVYTRVMGYHRPVESFNLGKKGEHNQHNRRVEIYYTADEPKGYHFDKVPVIKIDSFVETDVPMPIN